MLRLPSPPQMLISWCYFKKLLNSVCEAKWIRVTEWGLLSVSCLEQGSEINDIFRLGGTSLPKLPLRSPPAISGVDTPHIRFCTTALVPWVPETFLARFPVSVKSRADKYWAVKRALRYSFNVWCGVGLARALFPRFRCAWRQAKFSFLQTGNPIFFL